MNTHAHAEEPDLLCVIIEWLARETKLSMKHLRRLEDDLRHNLGGRGVYIARTSRLQIDDRNTLIMSAYLARVPIPTIARQFSLTQRRIRQICAGLDPR